MAFIPLVDKIYLKLQSTFAHILEYNTKVNHAFKVL